MKRKKILKKAKKCLKHFGVNYKGDTIYLTSGGNSVIANPKEQWKIFAGHSINQIAIYVAYQESKKIKRID